MVEGYEQRGEHGAEPVRTRKLTEERCPQCRVRLMEEYDRQAAVRIICPNTACGYSQYRDH
jgi:hypothetical protein